MFSGMHLLAILGAFIAIKIIMDVWYSRTMFQKSWIGLAGMDDQKFKDLRGRLKKTMMFHVGARLVTIFGLSMVLNMLGAHDWMTGAGYAVILWAAFVAPQVMVDIVNSERNLKLWWLDAGVELVGLAAAGAILGAW